MEAKLVDVYEILDRLGVQIASETGREINCFCPFHNNSNTAAFSINIESGAWLCRNGACGEKGNLKQLWEKLRPQEKYPISNTQIKVWRDEKEKSAFISEIETYLYPDLQDKTKDWSDYIEKQSHDINDMQYMADRGFGNGVLEAFEVGFNKKMNRVIIPVRDERHRVVGLIGRAVNDEDYPKYKYTYKFPKQDILFNLNYAKAYRSVILVEGSLDCMKVFQAGYPNVCAVLGSYLSDAQTELIHKNFLSVIIFTDRDDAGYGLANSIANKCSSRAVYYANWDLIDESKNDPGALTDDEIRTAIDNKISDIEVCLDW